MSTASDMVAAYLDAERAVLLGKTVQVAGRQLSRENLDLIRAGRHEWERKLAVEQATAAGVRSSGYATAVFTCGGES